jgi:PTS system galactitol-specific IIA component
MSPGWTNERLILPGLHARTAAEVIGALGDLLCRHGYVRDTFTAAVGEREKVFATGLPTPEIQVAIPHADVEHVIHPAIAIAALAEPVEFGEMGNPGGTVSVKLVFMLAVAQSQVLVSLLQRLVELFQQPAFLRRLLAADDPARIAADFNEQLPVFEEA